MLKRLSILLVTCLHLSAAIAQPNPTVEQANKALCDQLQGKTAFLRSRADGEKLTFDAQGNLQGTAKRLPFGLSAVLIKKTHLANGSLHIQGTRAFLTFNVGADTSSADAISPVSIADSKIDIDLAFDGTQPNGLNVALHNVFAPRLVDILGTDTEDERRRELYSVASLTTTLGGSQKDQSPGNGPTHIDDPHAVIPPKVIHSVNPNMSEELRRDHINGTCVVSLVIDENGFPTHIRIARSLRSELDIEAIGAASQYRFEPAVYKGKPVSVKVNVDIPFHS